MKTFLSNYIPFFLTEGKPKTKDKDTNS